MKHKRVSRHELKTEVKELRARNVRLDVLLSEEIEKYNRLEERFQELLLNSELADVQGGGVKVVEAEPVPFGKYYMTISDISTGWIKSHLAESIARGLMDANMIKFYYGDPVPGPFEGRTIGAKVLVVQPEKLVTGIKIHR